MYIIFFYENFLNFEYFKSALHQKSLDYLISIDRQILSNEMTSRNDEKNKLIAEIAVYQENERVLKRERKSLNFFKEDMNDVFNYCFHS